MELSKEKETQNQQNMYKRMQKASVERKNLRQWNDGNNIRKMTQKLEMTEPKQTKI